MNLKFTKFLHEKTIRVAICCCQIEQSWDNECCESTCVVKFLMRYYSSFQLQKLVGNAQIMPQLYKSPSYQIIKVQRVYQVYLLNSYPYCQLWWFETETFEKFAHSMHRHYDKWNKSFTISCQYFKRLASGWS
jgi:hypothetical protein